MIEGRETRQRAVEAAARADYSIDGEVFDAARDDMREDCLRCAEATLDAAVPIVLDDIEAMIQNRAKAPKLAKTEALRLIDLICNAVLDEVLGDVAAWRERNGWSRD